jgi:hypothetical protein
VLYGFLLLAEGLFDNSMGLACELDSRSKAKRMAKAKRTELSETRVFLWIEEDCLTLSQCEVLRSLIEQILAGCVWRLEKLTNGG